MHQILVNNSDPQASPWIHYFCTSDDQVLKAVCLQVAHMILILRIFGKHFRIVLVHTAQEGSNIPQNNMLLGSSQPNHYFYGPH